ncbi:MAG: ribonuclease III [Chloroflexi bacterium RBG_13_46_14]|nr:MAG: ribonuclease III [Chloroflexi bacterium RBG_13_46_14]
MVDLNILQKTLGIKFRDISLLEKSLVHRSYLNENQGVESDSNERLEYLGDAVLGFIVAEKLYRDFPDYDEGRMTRLRSVLVRRETLARISRSINLGEYLFLGKGEDTSGGRNKSANLACALEAVIGAVYLDQGMVKTRKMVIKLLAEEWQKAIKKPAAIDYKSRLQELIQSREQRIPSYQVTGASGPDHIKTFSVEVRLGNQVLGSGSGKSKKEAETEAARQALEKIS